MTCTHVLTMVRLLLPPSFCRSSVLFPFRPPPILIPTPVPAYAVTLASIVLTIFIRFIALLFWLHILV